MKAKTQLFFLLVLFFYSSAFSQNIDTKSNTQTNEIGTIDLQTYIETTYLNAVKQFRSNNYPYIEKGKFKVMIITPNNEYMVKDSSYFKDKTANDIKEFIYVHHVETTNSLGAFTDHYGMITIKIK